MNLLENLMGGGQQQNDYNDFVNRYDQGAPYDGISGEEAFNRYQQVAPNLSPQMYQEAAHDAFSRMSPQERMQFGQMLQQRMGGGMGGRDFQLDDPRELAGLTSRFRQQNQGGDLLSMFGMGGGGGRDSGGGLGDMLDNPIAKAALGGIAAIAMKRMLSR